MIPPGVRTCFASIELVPARPRVASTKGAALLRLSLELRRDRILEASKIHFDEISVKFSSSALADKKIPKILKPPADAPNPSGSLRRSDADFVSISPDRCRDSNLQIPNILFADNPTLEIQAGFEFADAD